MEQIDYEVFEQLFLHHQGSSQGFSFHFFYFHFSRKISYEDGVTPTPGIRMESLQSLYVAPSSESFQRIPLQARSTRKS